MSAHEGGRLALGRGLHFLPQADRSLRVVAGTGCQFQTDQVGFAFVGAAVGQRQAVLHGHLSCLVAGITQSEQGACQLGAHLCDVGSRDGFAAMLAQGVGNFVPHDLGDLVIAELQLVDDAGVEQNFAAGRAAGVQLVVFDQVDFPVPAAGVGAEMRDFLDQLAGDRVETAHGRGVGVEQALLLGFCQGLLIGLVCHLVDLFG